MSADIDSGVVARELVRTLRGRRSQTALSRRLGYRTNVLYNWEAGRDYPTAAKFFNFAARVGIDIRDSLQRFYRSQPSWMPAQGGLTREHVAELLRDLQGGTSIIELSRTTGYSRFQIARWLSGATEPKLPAFLDMIEATSLRLLDFVAALVDPMQLPSLAAAYRDLVATRRAAHDVPWSQAVLRCLELSDYQALPRHQPGWIGERLGLSLDEETQCLSLLADSGQIRERDGRWQATRVLALDTRRDQESTQALREFWAQTALSAMGEGKSQVASYNVFGVSDADLQRLRELWASYFRQMRTIIARSEPVEHVVLANFQLVGLSTPPQPPQEQQLRPGRKSGTAARGHTQRRRR